MGAFVPDASATLAWFFEDESSEPTDALLARLKSGDSAVVPRHRPVEVANALLVAVRRGRINKDKAARFFGDLLALPIRVDLAGAEIIFGKVFSLSEQYGLTVYDAAHLELASREGVALATLDDDLQKASRAAGVPLTLQK